LTPIHIARCGMLERGFFHVAAVRSKIVAGYHRDRIGVGAVLAEVARKVDISNAGDDLTSLKDLFLESVFMT